MTAFIVETIGDGRFKLWAVSKSIIRNTAVDTALKVARILYGEMGERKTESFAWLLSRDAS